MLFVLQRFVLIAVIRIDRFEAGNTITVRNGSREKDC